MECSGITFDIPGRDRDCQVYLFWKKNDESGETAKEPPVGLEELEDAVQKWIFFSCLNLWDESKINEYIDSYLEYRDIALCLYI